MTRRNEQKGAACLHTAPFLLFQARQREAPPCLMHYAPGVQSSDR